MEAARSLYFCYMTRSHVPQDSNLLENKIYKKSEILIRQFTHIYSETSHSGVKYPFKIKAHYTHKSLVFGEQFSFFSNCKTQVTELPDNRYMATAEVTYSQNIL
jgi:hypothetical protein